MGKTEPKPGVNDPSKPGTTKSQAEIDFEKSEAAYDRLVDGLKSRQIALKTAADKFNAKLAQFLKEVEAFNALSPRQRSMAESNRFEKVEEALHAEFAKFEEEQAEVEKLKERLGKLKSTLDARQAELKKD